MSAHDSDDLLGEEGSQDDADNEADRLLEDMRQLNRDVAAAVNVVERKTHSFDDESDQMHSKLNSMALNIICDIKMGRCVDEPPSRDLTAAIGLPTEEIWQPPDLPAASLSAENQGPGSPMRRAAGGGRFKAVQPPQPQAEAKSLVSDISRLASRPLLDDSAPMPRRPGGRGLGSASNMGRGLGSGSSMSMGRSRGR